MISGNPIASAPTSGAEADSGPAGPQSYNLAIAEGIGFAEYIAERLPDVFEESADEGIAFIDFIKNILPFKLSALPNPAGDATFSIALIPTPAKPAPAVTIFWGDGSNDVVSGSAYNTWDWIGHRYAGSGPYRITMTGDLDCVTGWKTAVVESWTESAEYSTNTLSFRLQDLSSLENLEELGAHVITPATSTVTGTLSDLLSFESLRLFYLERLQSFTGDVSLLNDPALANVVAFYVIGADLSYTPGAMPAYSNFGWGFGHIPGLRDCGLTSTEVSNIVIDLNAAGAATGDFNLTANGYINPAGLVARAELIEREFYVWFDGTAEVDDAGLDFSDYTVWNPGYSKSIAETILMYDANGVGFHHLIAESLSTSDLIKAILGITAIDHMGVRENLLSTWKGSESLNSGLHAIDTSQIGKLFEDAVLEGISLADLSRIVLRLILLDSLVCISSAQASGLFRRQVSEAVTLNDSAFKSWEKLIEDACAFAEASALTYAVMVSANDALGIADDSGRLVFINTAVNESISLLSSLSLRSILSALLQEGIGLFSFIALDGEAWECWVLNTNKFHPSIYSGFDFNSYAVFEGKAYGCKPDGIYELSGESDNGATIHSGAVLPETDFGAVNMKRFRKAFLGILGGSPAIKFENESDYAFYSLRNDTTTINRSLFGKDWTLSVMDFDELEFIELIPVILSR